MKQKIEEYLETKQLARDIIEYDILDSTQIMARNMVNKVQNGTMILADNQINGIGTHDRKWYSEENSNITFTLILYPNCKITELEGLTIKIAECIVEVLKKSYNIEANIKEPNDVIVNGKKIAGILTKTSTIEENVQYLLIGIGLNVNQEQFPKELESVATSLKKEYNKKFEREKIIAEICNKIENVTLMDIS